MITRNKKVIRAGMTFLFNGLFGRVVILSLDEFFRVLRSSALNVYQVKARRISAYIHLEGSEAV
jgi:hypothetical protein